MRTNSFFSAALLTLFCCFFSASLEAQFMKKLDKFAQKVEKTTKEVAKVNNSVQTVRQEIKVLTETEPEQKTTEVPATEQAENSPNTTDKGTTANSGNENPKPAPVKIKVATPTEKVASGQSKNISINGASATVRNMLNAYTAQIISCQGNSSDQTVTLTFMMEHQLANQSLYIYSKDTKAYAKGQDYTNTDQYVGSKSFSNTVPTDIPMECRLVIRNVVSSVKSFDSVIMNMKTQNKDGGKGDQKGTLELRNLAIEWN